MTEIKNEELETALHWFNAVQDLNPSYLRKEDYVLAKKIHEIIGIRTPESVMRGI